MNCKAFRMGLNGNSVSFPEDIKRVRVSMNTKTKTDNESLDKEDMHNLLGTCYLESYSE